MPSSIRFVGKALLFSLTKHDFIQTPLAELRVEVDHGYYCALHGGTPYEQSLFLESLHTLLNPIENPRYVITRKSRWKVFTRKDYHAVPDVLGQKKTYAQFFALMWKKYVGANDLIYTRTEEGRAHLLYARQHALSTQFRKRSERRLMWR